MHRTDSYVMTAYTDSAGDMLEIETVRNTVKSINKQNARVAGHDQWKTEEISSQ